MKWSKLIPSAFFVMGILLGLFHYIPTCYAGGAAILVPADDMDMPQGSQIPQWRSKEIEKRVIEYKIEMRENAPTPPQESLPPNEVPSNSNQGSN